MATGATEAAIELRSTGESRNRSRGNPGTGDKEEVLLEVRGLKKYFPILGGLFRRPVGYARAVDGVDFYIRRGETLGLVGESGSGKTTAGMCILHLIEPTAGKIRFNRDGEFIEVNSRTVRSLRRSMQIIFQDPYSSLDPRMMVQDIIAEPLEAQGVRSRRERYERVEELLNAVGMSSQHMRRFPHEFSGGQRQRIGIARALALNPSLIVCDEPVSALDVSVQAQVLNLLDDLQERFGLTYLFIAHDLSVVQHVSDRVAVMYLGKIVEIADVEELFNNPRHPYTEALFSAIPVPDPDFQYKQIILEGDVPSPIDPPPGCNFHPRCRYARAICSKEEPVLREVGGDGHLAACHFADDLVLMGVWGPGIAQTG
ncbi:MAG TPA: ABC transporter ATP-binding protein [Firmicutes bacterium]|nr:ABC transporter ATP-binding protein [Bacillota bacterium]